LGAVYVSYRAHKLKLTANVGVSNFGHVPWNTAWRYDNFSGNFYFDRSMTVKNVRQRVNPAGQRIESKS
jgi:hypothetical protein